MVQDELSRMGNSNPPKARKLEVDQKPKEDVWCRPSPFTVAFHPEKSKYNSWILFLCLCHHFPSFKDNFIATAQSKTPKIKQWYINRHHFPRALLENRSTYGVSSLISLLTEAAAERIVELIGNKRLLSTVNRVSQLKTYAEEILPEVALRRFRYQAGKKSGKGHQPPVKDHYYVQAPVGKVLEAKQYIATVNQSQDEGSTSPSGNANPPRVLARLQKKSKFKRWVDDKILAVDDGADTKEIPLPQGSNFGCLRIYPNMVPTWEAKNIAEDLRSKPYLFREYPIQGINKEPRLQAHFHHEATMDYYNCEQPGYKYNTTIVKGIPISVIPSLQILADRTRKLNGGEEWNIGTTVVLYRSGKDKMGQHSGESSSCNSWVCCFPCVI